MEILIISWAILRRYWYCRSCLFSNSRVSGSNSGYCNICCRRLFYGGLVLPTHPILVHRYGYIHFVFLNHYGVIHRDKASLSVMFMVFVWMGGFIWGLFPIDPKVSWEGHIAGSIAGIILALSLGLRWKVLRTTRLPAPEDPYAQFDVNQSDS